MRRQAARVGSIVRHCLLAATALAAVLLLTSCPNPIPTGLASQVSDEAGPVITITAPQEGDTYQSTVLVSGTVEDGEAGAAGGAGTIASVTLSVPAAELTEDLELNEDGAFSAPFSTAGLSSTVTVTVSATDWNGNTTSMSRSLENDMAGPHIQITEPAHYSAYATVVRVSGTITDAEGATTTGEVFSCRYAVAGTELSGTLELGEDGAFSFEFATRLPDGTEVLVGPTVIEVVAEDWNGNVTTESVTVTKAQTGDFASMEVTPGDREVTVVWDPVLYAERYRIHNARIGSIAEDATSPFLWQGLTNGEKYSFQIQAVLPEDAGADAWSSTEDAIPLSARTIAPRVAATEYESISIEWAAIPGATEYEVERRVGDGEWLVRTVTPHTRLTDADLDWHESYAYRVTPHGQRTIPSEEIVATPGRFADSRFVQLATLPLADRANGVAVAGSVGYVACDEAGLAIVDIADPNAPVLLGSCDTLGDAYEVALYGDYAIVAADDAGVQIVDVADASAPTVIGGYDTTGYAWEVVVEGNLAYVGDSWNGVVILDLTTPSAPSLVGHCDTRDAREIALAGEYLYVADTFDGLRVVDVSTPQSPFIAASYDPGYTLGVAVAGNHAYLANSSVGLRVVSIATPTAPSLVGSWSDAGLSEIAVSGAFLYVGTRLRAIDVSNPASPQLAAESAITGGINEIEVDDGYLYVAGGDGELITLDGAAPAWPTRVGQVATGNRARSIVIAGDTVYMGDDAAGLAVIDVTDSRSPDLLVHYEPLSDARGVSVAGHHAYVADQNGGLRVLDVSSPAQPSLVGSDSSLITDTSPSGEHLYVSRLNTDVQAFDISDPTDPFSVWSYDTPGQARSVCATATRLFVADGTSGLLVFELTDPENPTVFATYSDGGDSYAVDSVGDYAYVAAGSAGLLVFDITDSATTTAVGSYGGCTGAVDVDVCGSFAYVADVVDGLIVLDVSDPTDPQLLGQWQDGTEGLHGIAVAGRYAYAINDVSGLHVLDLVGSE